MKKLTYLVLAVMCLVPVGLAVNITDVSVNPDREVWLTEQFNITASCAQNAPHVMYIENLTAQDGEPAWQGLSEDKLKFDLGVLSYSTIQPYLLQPGRYFFDLSCTSSGDTDSFTGNFTVQELVIPTFDVDSEHYTDEEMQVLLNIRSEPSGQAIEKNVGFTAYMDDQQIQIQQPTPYLKGDMWALNMSMPVEGTHTLRVVAEHDGGAVSASQEVEISDPVSFEADLQGDIAQPGEDLRLSIDARYRGDEVAIDKEDIDITLDGRDMNDAVTDTGSAFAITMPDKNPGTYELRVDVEKGEIDESEEFTVRYPVELEGEFETVDGDLLPFSIEFWQDDTKVKEVDGEGEYSDSIVPRIYEVLFTFPHPQLESSFRMTEVDVESWENPLRYARYTDLDRKVPGIRLGGLYAFKTGLDPDSISATMDYRTSNIQNPEDLDVFRCGGWNMEKGFCYDEWNEVVASFDDVASSFQIDPARDGAYAVGVREDLAIKHSFEKTTYTPNEEIDVTGTVDASGKVGGANVSLAIPGTGIQAETTTDGSGVFEFTVPTPNSAGEHMIDIRAEKDPYVSDSISLPFEIIRPSDLRVESPESIEVSANSSTTVRVQLSNTGFSEIDQITPFVEDVPFLGEIEMDRRSLHMNQSRLVSMYLDVPANTSADTYTAEPVFSYDGKNVSTVFGITVERSVEQESNTTTTSTGMIASEPSLPSVSSILGTDDGVTIALIIGLLLQAGIVGFFFVRHYRAESRSGVSNTVTRIKASLGEGGGADAAQKRGRKEIKRDRFLTTLNNIKNEIREHRQIVE